MEYVDIYDASHRPTGRRMERDGAVGEGEWVLLVHVCVFDLEGRMLIQKRHSGKDRYPGCWDVSAGGFVQSGEESLQAARRELWEELGLEAGDGQLRFILTEPFKWVLDDFYYLPGDCELSQLRPQPEEVSELKWAEREEVFAMLEDGRFVDYSPRLMEKLFDFALGQGRS